MDVFTPKTTRRSTRLRVEIPVRVTSMDRRHPFSASCIALVVSPQGGGLQAPQALPLETPVLLSDLPGGASASAIVASCRPVGNDGKRYLLGVSLYNHGNIWGIAEPPQDWDVAAAATGKEGKAAVHGKDVWPYNLSSSQHEIHPHRK